MDVFDRAIRFAAEAHSGMVRRGENAPYILHPMEVASIVGTMTGDREILAAAILHDTVEDTPVTLGQLQELFGPRVAALVASETEDKRPDQPPAETWFERKTETLQVLEFTRDRAVKMIWLGDKLSNMRSFHRAWKISGNSLWDSFNQKDPAEHAWYYSAIADALQEDLGDTDAWHEYAERVSEVFSRYRGAVLTEHVEATTPKDMGGFSRLS